MEFKKSWFQEIKIAVAVIRDISHLQKQQRKLHYCFFFPLGNLLWRENYSLIIKRIIIPNFHLQRPNASIKMLSYFPDNLGRIPLKMCFKAKWNGRTMSELSNHQCSCFNCSQKCFWINRGNTDLEMEVTPNQKEFWKNRRYIQWTHWSFIMISKEVQRFTQVEKIIKLNLKRVTKHQYYL